MTRVDAACATTHQRFGLTLHNNARTPENPGSGPRGRNHLVMSSSRFRVGCSVSACIININKRNRTVVLRSRPSQRRVNHSPRSRKECSPRFGVPIDRFASIPWRCSTAHSSLPALLCARVRLLFDIFTAQCARMQIALHATEIHIRERMPHFFTLARMGGGTLGRGWLGPRFAYLLLPVTLPYNLLERGALSHDPTESTQNPSSLSRKRLALNNLTTPHDDTTTA